jgi:hypothetical protein
VSLRQISLKPIGSERVVPVGSPTVLRRALHVLVLAGATSAILRMAEIWLLLRLRAAALPLLEDQLTGRINVNSGETERASLVEIGKTAATLFKLEVGTTVVFIVALMLFLYVAYRLLHAAAVPRLTFGPRSAALLLLVPIWNLVHWLWAFQQIFRASAHDPRIAYDWRDEEGSARVLVAWLFVVCSIVLDTVAATFADKSGDLLLDTSVPIWIGTSVLAVVAFALQLSAAATITDRIDVLMVGSQVAAGAVPGWTFDLRRGLRTGDIRLVAGIFVASSAIGLFLYWVFFR